MKLLLLAFALISIAGCKNSSTEWRFPVMPEDMKDCKIFHVQNEYGIGVTIARCPNSTTTSTNKSGRLSNSTIAIDGVEHKK